MFALLTVVPAPPTAQAANTIPFTPRFTANANGANVTIGNTLLTCPASASNCTAARAGASADNNAFNMVHLDADGVAGTTNSSMSQLNLPAGSAVLWAGLYWGARLQAGTGGTGGNASAINTMSFRTPGAASYQTINAASAARDQFGPNSASSNAYQRFADVTSLVRAAGNGAYWGANVTAATGQDRYAGWAMTVVYTAPGLPLRNLTVFDGFNVVSAGNPQSIAVSGFQAPQAGTVDAQLTMIAYEGDLSQTGDFTRLNNTQLATALSPGSNFFDSANGLNGASVTTRTPADRNQLGFDIKNLGVSGAIPNGATTAQFTFSSNGDIYYPGVVGLAINLYAPDFTASSKTAVNLNGNTPARPGDTLQYTLNYANTGQDPAVGVVSEDVLPANTTYVPGSLALVNPLTGATTPLTDATGDDTGEYVAASRTVRVRLGGAATATAGGRMACSGSGCVDDGTSRVAYTFQVTLTNAAGGTTVTNLANLNYRTGTTNIAATYTTNPASVDVTNRADVSITKELTPDPAPAGTEVVGTITVTNGGPNTATGVTVRDPVPDGWTDISMETPPGVACTVGTVIDCTVPNIANGASVVIQARGSIAPGVTQSTLTNVAYATTTAHDTNLTNNVTSDTITLIRTADLAITKAATPATAAPGATVSYTLSVTNNGPSNALDLVITDTVDNAAQLTLTAVTGTTGGAACAAPQGSSLRCTVATLAPGAIATVTVSGVLAPALAPGVVAGNAATVTAATVDPDSTNNRAVAAVTTATRSADLQLTKTGPASAVAGTGISYTLVASNAGPSDAQATVLTDNIPAEIVATSVSTTRGTCNIQQDTPVPGRQRLLCSFVGFAAGATATVTINGTVAANTLQPSVTNTGTLQSITLDPAPGNNTATAVTAVTRSYDLAVTKRANRSSLPAAAPDDTRPVVYTITVTNAGPSAATGVEVSDLIPVNDEEPDTALQFVAATPQSGSCEPPVDDGPDHHLLTCTLADPIPVGGSQAVVVEMLAVSDLADIGDPITETVTIEAEGDTNPTNDMAAWTLRGDPQSDLELVKTAPPTVVAGEMVTYRFEITNHPPHPEDEILIALAPTLVDTLPAGVTLVPFGVDGSVTPAYCEVDGAEVTCDTPDNIPPDATVVVELSVLVDPGVAGGTSLVNDAQVINHPSNPDPTPDNNFASATSTVATDADVMVAGMSIMPTDPGSTGPGSWRHITFTLTNNGPSTARNVEFRTGIDTDNTAIDPSTLPSQCAVLEGELVCTIDGNDLAPDQSVVISFRALIAGDVAAGPYSGHASVSSATPDSDLTNNDTSAPFAVSEPRTDVQITKTAVDTVENPADGDPSFVAGQTFAYEIVVSLPTGPGLGVADAQNVAVTDTMPDGFTATQVSTTRGACSVVGGGTGISCALGTLAAFPAGGEPITVTVHGLVDVSAEGEQIENVATASSTTPNLDGEPTSVDAAATVDVIEWADLQLFKTADAPTFFAGGVVGYTLTVVNAGPSDVENASIVDTLPAGLTLDPAASGDPSDDDEECAVTGGDPATGQEVTCVVGAVAVGASVPMRIVATTSPNDTPRTVTNTATVTSQATDPVPENNTASVDTEMDRLADVAISSSVSTLTPAAGGEITYTGFTINNGPSSAWLVTGGTTFPTGFVPVSVDVPFNACTWSPEPPPDPTTAPWEDVAYTLSCAPTDPTAPYAPGVASTTVVVMYVPGDTPQGDYPAVALIATETSESTTANNETRSSVYVQHVSDTAIAKTLVAPNPMVAGQPATWRLTVTNNGPSIADNVVISDAVPDGMTFVSAHVEGGANCPAPELIDEQVIVRCPVAEIGVGGSASAMVTFEVDPAATGELCNSALVGSGSLDPDFVDNETEDCSAVVQPAPADVAVTLTPVTATLPPGGEARYTAVIHNNGPGPATNVVFTIDTPAWFTDYSGVLIDASDGTSPHVTCVAGSLVCTIGDLAAGQQVRYRITGTANGEPGEELTLTGTAVHDSGDTEPANDTASATITLIAGQTTTTTTSTTTAGPPPPPTTVAPPDPPDLPTTGIAVLSLLALAAFFLVAGETLRRGARPR